MLGYHYNLRSNGRKEIIYRDVREKESLERRIAQRIDNSIIP